MFVRGADGGPLSACYAIVLVDVQGASIVDSGLSVNDRSKGCMTRSRRTKRQIPNAICCRRMRNTRHARTCKAIGLGWNRRMLIGCLMVRLSADLAQT